jgi:hypothetical protein
MAAAGELRLLIHSKQSNLVDVLEEELADYENASGIGPFTCIRHQELQTAWRKSFPNKELVTWNDFWRSFPQNLSRCAACGNVLEVAVVEELMQFDCKHAPSAVSSNFASTTLPFINCS